MGKAYPQEAIEEARKLYCRHGGKNHDAIEAGMRKAGYVGWKKQLLYDKGRPGTKDERNGWVVRFGFDTSLKIHIEKLVTGVNDDEQDLYLGIRTVRKEMQKKVAGGAPTKDELYQYRDFCKLEIEARRNLDLSRDNFETFVSGYEKLIGWLADLDPAAAKMVIKHGDRLSELAQAHYGKPEEDDDGTGPGEDEGGDGPGTGTGNV